MNPSNNPNDAVIDMANQVHRSAMRLVRLLRDTRPGKGMGASKLSVLGRLYRDGMTTATALAAYLRIQPQSLTRLAADLEQEGLIRRRPNRADRRQRPLEITEAGVRLLTGEIGGQRRMLAQIIAKELTPTEQKLLQLAAGMMDHLAEAVAARAAALDNQRRSECSAEDLT